MLHQQWNLNRQLQNYHYCESVFLYCCITLGSMDEVLASLQRGQIQLRKVPASKTAPPTKDPRSTLMSAIRQGVTLKKVRCSTRTENMTKPSARLINRPGQYIDRYWLIAIIFCVYICRWVTVCFLMVKNPIKRVKPTINLSFYEVLSVLPNWCILFCVKVFHRPETYINRPD